MIVHVFVPPTPDPDEARTLLRRELEQNQYDAVEPNAVDRFLNWVLNQIWRAFTEPKESISDWFPLLTILLILAVLIFVAVALGRFRLRAARSAQVGALGGVFDDDDARSASEIRDAARAAATRGNFSLAVIEQFRALTRDLVERTIIAPSPGLTAGGYVDRLKLPFPTFVEAARQAASRFDEVRYMDASASASDWESMRSLDEELRKTTPASLASVAEWANA